jgi:hypothetical protein|tara:strand:- start:233 stop:442 length:210 start_codon:yes stop_codon:yes gene_type:complete
MSLVQINKKTMDIFYIALLLFIITGWQFLRTFLVDTKKIVIPKWLDFSITIIIVVLTIYVVYDTFRVVR